MLVDAGVIHGAGLGRGLLLLASLSMIEIMRGSAANVAQGCCLLIVIMVYEVGVKELRLR